MAVTASARPTTPTGTLNRKIHLQVVTELIPPPAIGPKTKASMTATPIYVICVGYFSGGTISMVRIVARA